MEQEQEQQHTEKEPARPAGGQEQEQQPTEKEPVRPAGEQEQTEQGQEQQPAHPSDGQADAEAAPPVADQVKAESPASPADQQPQADTQTEEFDWDNVQPKGFGDDYSEEERVQMEKLYEETLTEIEEKEVVSGRVVGISDRDVILNIGFKSDGLISASEFRDIPDLKIGDEVEVYIEEQENANGQLVLSRKKAKIVQAWEEYPGSFMKRTWLLKVLSSAVPKVGLLQISTEWRHSFLVHRLTLSLSGILMYSLTKPWRSR